jgi:hypothetical protein
MKGYFLYAVCQDEWNCTTLVPEQLEECIHIGLFMSHSPVHLDNRASETRALQMGLKAQNSNFLENISNNSD